MADSAPPPTLALLGAKGATGQVVLRTLLAKEPVPFWVNIYVRSKSKLLQLFPGLESKSQVKIFEGSVEDVGLIKELISGAEIIICTLGDNNNKPTHVIEPAARSVVAALEDLKRSKPDREKPRVLLLSSSTKNTRFVAARPVVVHWLIKTAFCYPYADLGAAESIFLDSLSLLSLLRVQPPAIIDEPGSGFEISTEEVRLAVSYEDLGAAFVELATEESYESLTQVGVSSKSTKGAINYGPEIFQRIVVGLWNGLWF